MHKKKCTHTQSCFLHRSERNEEMRNLFVVLGRRLLVRSAQLTSREAGSSNLSMHIRAGAVARPAAILVLTGVLQGLPARA